MVEPLTVLEDYNSSAIQSGVKKAIERDIFYKIRTVITVLLAIIHQLLV